MSKIEKRAAAGSATLGPDDDLERRNLLHLLNKITPTKFDHHCDRFLSRTRIGSSDDLLRSAVRAIAERGADDARYGPMFANLCARLAEVPTEDLEGSVGGGAAVGATGTFREALLERCRAVLSDPEEYLALARNGTAVAEEMRGKEDPEDISWREMAQKGRYVGHARFVGELYLNSVLGEDEAHDILASLLAGALSDRGTIDELKLEAFVALLRTCGENLEGEEARQRAKDPCREMGYYVESVKNLVRERDQEKIRLSNRMKFILLDLLETKDNGWRAKQNRLVAATLAQIRKEARKVRPIG